MLGLFGTLRRLFGGAGSSAKARTPVTSSRGEADDDVDLDLPASCQQGLIARARVRSRVDDAWLRAFTAGYHWAQLEVCLAPGSSVRLMDLVDDPHTDARTLAAAIQSDPAVAAALLRLAGSALYRGAGDVDLESAIVRVGHRQLRSLLLTVLLNTRIVKGGASGAMATMTWKHSLACARLASKLAPRVGLSTESAYLAGLFHDCGVLAVLALAHSDPGTPTALLDAIDTHGYPANARVVADWNLPAEVVEAVCSFREPQTPLAALVALANDLCKRHGLWTEPRVLTDAQLAGLTRLALDPAELPDRAAVCRIAREVDAA